MDTNPAHRNTAPPRLETAKAAAARIGIPYSSLRDIVFRGELPVVRVGGGRRQRWYLERTDVDRWIETRKERS